MKKVLPVIAALLFLFACKKDKKPVQPPPTHITTTFTIPADSVMLNPNGDAPLSALIHFKTTIKGHTEIIVKGKNGAESDVAQAFTDNSTYHSIPIIGLYANYSNEVEIYVIDSKKDTAISMVNITTGALPPSVPNFIHTDVVNLSQMQKGMDLVSSFSGYPSHPFAPYVADSFGDIRWCLDFRNDPELDSLNYDCGIARLQNGNYRFGDIASNKIYEVDILGKIVNRWTLGGYQFHHDIYEKPNGNFLISVSKPGSTHTDGTPTSMDFVIEIDRASGNIVNTWDLRESLNEYRRSLIAESVDWIHVNGLVYSASDNTIIVSGRVQGVFKLTNDNHVKWVFGTHRGWGKNRRGEDLNQYLLTPLDANGNAITDTAVVNGWVDAPDFEWSWYQHSPQLMPNGDLLVFDNGYSRNYDPAPTKHFSRAVEFKIDEANMTVQQVWAYGEDRKDDTFSAIVSSVRYYPETNHILFSPGYQVPNSTGKGGKIVEVDYATKQVVFQQSISSPSGWGFHRAIRMDLYPNGNPYQ